MPIISLLFFFQKYFGYFLFDRTIFCFLLEECLKETFGHLKYFHIFHIFKHNEWMVVILQIKGYSFSALIIMIIPSIYHFMLRFFFLFRNGKLTSHFSWTFRKYIYKFITFKTTPTIIITAHRRQGVISEVSFILSMFFVMKLSCQKYNRISYSCYYCYCLLENYILIYVVY